MSEQPHIPVLLNEVLQSLGCDQGGVFVDGTFGAGGYTRAILNSNPKARVIAFDRDPDVSVVAESMKREFPDRFTFIADCFGAMANYIREPVDGIVLDVGVSSMQIDQADRGFSFRFDGPLDMRMGQNGMSARDVVMTFSERQLADILFQLGEEKASRRIAAAIVRARTTAPIDTTLQLAEIIHGVMPRPTDGSDSATRSFQALRIFVNDELGELTRALDASKTLLNPGGRLVVVSFHSLEDRIVKNFMIQNSDLRPNQNRHMPVQQGDSPIFKVLTKKPIVASVDELGKNARAHSAKLRAALRLEEGG